MAEDKMYVVICLRREVPDRETGRMLYDLVKLRLADRPDIIVSGSCSNHFQDDPVPPA